MFATIAKQYFRETMPKYSLPFLLTWLLFFVLHDRIVESIAASNDMELQLTQNVFYLSSGVQLGSCLGLWLANFFSSLLRKELVTAADYLDLSSNALLVTCAFTAGLLATVSSTELFISFRFWFEIVDFRLWFEIVGWLLGLHFVAVLVTHTLSSLRYLAPVTVTVVLLLFQVGSVFAQAPEPTVHEIELPSGAVATVTMSMTAGEIIVATAIGFLITLHLWEVARSLTHLMTKR